MEMKLVSKSFKPVLRTAVRVKAQVDMHIACQIEIKSTMKGQKWYMHEHDKDINDPSCPHCHAKGKKWKLDIYTGHVYEYPDKHYKGKISKSEMKKMWSQEGFLELVIKERQWYEENMHESNPVRYPLLPPLPISVKHNKVFVRVTTRWINNNRSKYN